MDGRAYYKISDGKLIGVFNRTGRKNLYLRAITALIVLANKKTVAKVVIFSELTK